jgi:integrase/recombinase XerD
MNTVNTDLATHLFNAQSVSVRPAPVSTASLATELDLIEDYLSLQTFTTHTEKDRRYLLKRFLTWIDQAGLQHEALTVRQVKEWMDVNGWGNSLCYQTAAAIRVFSVWRFGETHPLAKLRTRLEDPGEQRTLSAAEVKILWTYLDKAIKNRRNEDARLRDRAILSLDTGLRATEICRLEINRLSLDGRCLQVMGKGRHWRKCVISGTTVGRLQEWLAIRETLARKDCGTVFVGLELNLGGKNTDAGKPMTRNSLFQVMQRLGKATGMYLTVHCLRRTFATLAIQRGAPTRLVQIQGGWSSVSQVERYTRALTPDDFIGYFPTEI